MWIYDKPAIFILAGRVEGYAPSATLNQSLRIIGGRVQEGSTTYTDYFKSYLGLSEVGYRHEYVTIQGVNAI